MNTSKKKPIFINQRHIFEENIFIINDLIQDFKYKKIINSIKFSCFFSKTRERTTIYERLKQCYRVVKFFFSINIYKEFSFEVESKNAAAIDSVVFSTINTTNAPHYTKLESKLTELVEQELISKGFSVTHCCLTHLKVTKRYNFFLLTYAKFFGAVIFASFMLKTLSDNNKDAKKLVLYEFESVYFFIVKYLVQYKLFSAAFKKIKPKFLITVNENWMPQSVIIDCCKDLNIPTALYPHGTLNVLNLPSACDILLFWNGEMKKSFEEYTLNKEQNLTIGAIEPLVGDVAVKSDERLYDVLLISQLSVTNEDENIIYKDIFFVWESFLEQHAEFKLCIKMHPFEGDKEMTFFNEVFGRFGERVSIMRGSEISIKELILQSKRVSTVSSTAIQYCYYLRKPVLLYKPPKLLVSNFPIQEDWSFNDLEELEFMIENEDTIFADLINGQYKWVEEIEIKKNVKVFIDNLNIK